MPMRPKSHEQRERERLAALIPDTATPRVRMVYDKKYEEKRRDTPALAKAAKIRSSLAWKNCRKIHLAKHPLCLDPFKKHKKKDAIIVAGEVHHIVGLATNPTLAFNEINLASLCSTCHGIIERIERSGRTTQHLFEGKVSVTPPRIL